MGFDLSRARIGDDRGTQRSPPARALPPSAGGGSRAEAALANESRSPHELDALKLSSNDAIIRACEEEVSVRTTIALDDDLIAKAQAYTGVEEKSALVREALKALIQREAAKRLANLGGSQPGIKSVPRRRQDVK